MNEQFGPTYRYEGHHHHGSGLLYFVVPLAIGFMIGSRRGMFRQGMGPGRSWENGVPPFFAELHRRAHAAREQPEATEA